MAPSKQYWVEYIKENPEKWKEKCEKISKKLKGKHNSSNTEFKTGHLVKEEWKQTYSKKYYISGVGSYRKRALENKGRQCEICGIKEGFAKIIVHHIKKWDRKNIKGIIGKEYHNLENLIVVCRNCHARLHNLSSNLKEFKSITPIQQIKLGLRS